MKFNSLVLLLPLAVAACSNDGGSPTYLTTAVTKPPVFSPQASAVPAGCLSFRVTGYQSFVNGAWSGTSHALLGNEVLVGPGMSGGGDLSQRAFERILQGKPYSGDEWARFDYNDGAIIGQDSYTAQPGVVEGLWNYHAQGKITGGEGRFAGATGSWETQGPFLMYPAIDDPNGGVTLLWVVGHVCLKS